MAVQYITTKYKQGNIIELVFNIELDDTWYLCGNVQNYEIGSLHTTFEFESKE